MQSKTIRGDRLSERIHTERGCIFLCTWLQSRDKVMYGKEWHEAVGISVQ